MRRSKKIIVLFVLLAGASAFVLWYALDRRAKTNALPAVAEQTAGQNPAGQPRDGLGALSLSNGQAGTGPASAEPVDLAKHDGQTIDFSSGKPVVKDSPEDKAEIEKAAKEMAEAVKEVSFGPPPKKPGPPPETPKN